MRKTQRNPRLLVADFHDRVEEGDLLERQHIVVPIKTGGRIYGAISRQFNSKYPSVPIPDLAFRQTHFAPFDEDNHRTVTFVAYWSDEMNYTPDHAAIAAGRAMMRFSLESPKLSTRWGEPDPWTLSMPLFKGAEKSTDHIIAMEDELMDTYQALITRGLLPCEVEFVVRDRERVPVYS
jgi:hypothetical protein